MDNQACASYVVNTNDLQIQVDNPQKHVTAMETYITFRVVTSTKRSEFSENEYTVRRRYNDFVWLRHKIMESHPTHLIPPLPEKHSLLGQLDRYAKTFIMTRMSLLNRFLNRIANHPTLSFDVDLRVFLTSKQPEFNTYCKSNTGLLARFSASLQNLSLTYPTREKNPEFEAAHEYINKLGDKLATVNRISQKIRKEQKEYTTSLQELHPLFSQWARSEPELQGVLVTMANAVDKCNHAQKQMMEHDEREFSEPLKEYELYVDAVKEALNRRELMQSEYETTVNDLLKKREERDQLADEQRMSFGTSFWRSPQEVKELQTDKLNKAIESLKVQVDSNQDKLECSSEDLRVDLERWNAEKQSDLKKILTDMATQQIDMFEKCLQSWEDAIITLKDTSVTSKEDVVLETVGATAM